MYLKLKLLKVQIYNFYYFQKTNCKRIKTKQCYDEN